jgi:exopolyphosphatase/guanosine-5'-triphosphate,3'-diphosphate pyrophosphatase
MSPSNFGKSTREDYILWRSGLLYHELDLFMPASESPYFAAVDLGSNSFHMLIVRVDESRVETVDRVKEMVQIARGMKNKGGVTPAAQERALACLRRFGERLRDIPASHVRAVGTKTLRTAKNTRGFMKAAEKALGYPIQIISGYEEARLVYNGLANTIATDGSQRLVIDIGGGSTEFVIGRDYRAQNMESLGLGCVTYTDKHFSKNGVTEKAMRQAYVAACTELELIRRNYLKHGWDIAYGTSGTMRTIAQLLADADGGAVITRSSLEKLWSKLAKKDEELTAIKDLPKQRQDVLAAGVVILLAIFDQLKIDKVHVADATLKEGLIYDTLGRFHNHDSRVETVNKLLEQYHIDQQQARRVAESAQHFWRHVNGPELPGVSRSKILTWAAQLHEIGLSISHSGYHNHGHYILRHSDLAGFGRYEQYILANLVRVHRKKLKFERFADLDEPALPAFIPLMICLRLAVVLNRRREDIDVLPDLRVEDHHYTLRFPADWLEEHPLTQASLEQEANQFANIDAVLTIETVPVQDSPKQDMPS